MFHMGAENYKVINFCIPSPAEERATKLPREKEGQTGIKGRLYIAAAGCVTCIVINSTRSSVVVWRGHRATTPHIVINIDTKDKEFSYFTYKSF